MTYIKNNKQKNNLSATSSWMAEVCTSRVHIQIIQIQKRDTGTLLPVWLHFGLTMQDFSTYTASLSTTSRAKDDTMNNKSNNKNETSRERIILSPEKERFLVSVAAPPAKNMDRSYTSVVLTVDLILSWLFLHDFHV